MVNKQITFLSSFRVKKFFKAVIRLARHLLEKTKFIKSIRNQDFSLRAQPKSSNSNGDLHY